MGRIQLDERSQPVSKWQGDIAVRAGLQTIPFCSRTDEWVRVVGSMQ
jgi:hypothetical protein